jgi:hypothetical protein
MTVITATGYHEGVTYSLVADTEQTDPLRGIITQAPAEVITAVEALSGQSGHLFATGADIPISLDTVPGLIAGLLAATTVTTVTDDTGRDMLAADPAETPTGLVVY